MPLTRRYQPTHDAGETVLVGMDFSPLVPPGAGLLAPALSFWVNWPGDVVAADADWTVDPVVGLRLRGRAVWARIRGGVSGFDYQLRWRVNDTIGNVWQRTALLLVGETA